VEIPAYVSFLGNSNWLAIVIFVCMGLFQACMSLFISIDL